MEKLGRLVRQIVQDQIVENTRDLNCLFIVRYSGIKAPEMSTLRRSLRSCQANIFVVKNSISRRAFESKGLNELSKIVDGPCGIVFGRGDPVAISKVVYGFSKENENLKIEGGLLKDKMLSQNEIVALAKLPAREVLYAKLVGTLNSPLNAMVWIISGIFKKLVYVLDQVRQKKEKT